MVIIRGLNQKPFEFIKSDKFNKTSLNFRSHIKYV